jgi:hypothetical protein
MKSITHTPGIFRLCLASIAIISFGEGYAQTTSDTLKMDVTFVGEREMVVKDAIKLQSWPEPRRLMGGKRDFNYRLLSKRLNVAPDWTLIEPVRLKVDAPLSRLYRGYARAGYGLYNTPLLEISLTDLRSREGSWGIQASHFATDVPSDFIDNRYKDSGARVWLSRFIGKERVDLSANINSNNVIFYGNPVGDAVEPDTTLGPQERYLSFGSTLGFKSHHRDSTKLNHIADIAWIQLRDLTGTVEDNFGFTFEAGKFVGTEKFSLAASFNLDRLTIGTNNPDTLRSDAAIVGIEPTVTSYRGPLTVKVGAGLWVDADAQSRNGDGSTFHFYPRAEASIRLLKDLFVPYIRIGGGLEQNRLQSVLDDNPFFYAQLNSELRTTSRKADINLGMRGTLTDAVSFNIYAGTVKYEDYMYFINDSLVNSGSRFTTLFDTLRVERLGGDLNIDITKNLEIRLQAAIFNYDANGLDAAWNLPSYTAALDIDYTFLEQFSIKSTLNLVGERSSISQIEPEDIDTYEILESGLYSVALPSYLDLSLNIQYRYNERTAVWVNMNNLTGSKYKQWAGYPVQGFQALFGASYAF